MSFVTSTISWLAARWHNLTGLSINALVFLVGLLSIYVLLSMTGFEAFEQVKVLNMLSKAGLWTGLSAFYAKFYASREYDTERSMAADPVASAIINGSYYVGAALVIALS